MSWFSFVPAAVGFTIQQEQAEELAAAVEQHQRKLLSKVGAGFLPGLLGAIFGAGMMWGTQLMTARVTEATLDTIRQANTAEHAAIAAQNRVQDDRMNRIQADAAIAATNAASAARDVAELRGRVESVERLLTLQLQQRIK